MKLFLLITIAVAAMFAQDKNEPQTVSNVDLKRYTGVWYEIAKIPNSFQDHCIEGTKAEYYLKEDGTIKVINSCIDEDGVVDDAEGVARVVDKKTNSKLEVSFFSILGWRPVWGDYWILGLGENYEWVVVGTPDRKYGWILARDKKLNEQILNEAYAVLKKNEYDTSKFVLSKQ